MADTSFGHPTDGPPTGPCGRSCPSARGRNHVQSRFVHVLAGNARGCPPAVVTRGNQRMRDNRAVPDPDDPRKPHELTDLSKRS